MPWWAGYTLEDNDDMIVTMIHHLQGLGQRADAGYESCGYPSFLPSPLLVAGGCDYFPAPPFTCYKRLMW